MADRSRIPLTIPEFNTYINQTLARLIATNPDTGNPYWTDFTFTAGENTEWGTRSAAWHALYALYSNPATKTAIVNEQVKNFMDDFRPFGQPLLDKIKASGLADETDAAVFHIDLRRHEPSHHTLPIPLDCIPTITMKGRGTMEVHTRAGEDQSRPSIPVDAGANALQMAFYVSDGPIHSPLNVDDSGVQREIITKAHFIKELGTAQQGKWISAYFRWYNTHHPELAGPWSLQQNSVIS